MAESDAAGPAPRRNRRYTVSDVIREIDRSKAPMRAMLEQAERARAPFLASAERVAAIRREILGEESEGPPPTRTAKPSAPMPPPSGGASRQPERWRPPASTDAEVAEGWAVYERRDAPAWFVKRLREWWGPFDPSVVLHWVRLEREIKNLRHEIGTDQRSPEAFERDRLLWSAKDLVAYMEEIRMIPKRAPPPAGRPHRRTVEGLTVEGWVAAMAKEDPSFRYLSQRAAAKLGPFSARTIGTCEVWIQMKAMLEGEALEAAERAKAELEDRHGEDEDVGGFRQSSTKHGTGRQKATREELEHEREVAAFLQSKGERPRKKRAK